MECLEGLDGDVGEKGKEWSEFGKVVVVAELGSGEMAKWLSEHLDLDVVWYGGRVMGGLVVGGGDDELLGLSESDLLVVEGCWSSSSSSLPHTF